MLVNDRKYALCSLPISYCPNFFFIYMCVFVWGVCEYMLICVWRLHYIQNPTLNVPGFSLLSHLMDICNYLLLSTTREKVTLFTISFPTSFFSSSRTFSEHRVFNLCTESAWCLTYSKYFSEGYQGKLQWQ